MKFKCPKGLIGCVLGVSLLTLAGCGSTNVMDTYSFGNQVIQDGQSEITIALPYEMGRTSETLNKEGYPLVAYGSISNHIMINVEGIQAAPNKPLPTIAQYTEQKRAEFQGLGGTVNVEAVDLNGVPAQHISGSYYGNKLQLSFSQYIFEDKGVLWKITYQYPTDDQVGADISKEIQHKIYVTQKKEG